MIKLLSIFNKKILFNKHLIKKYQENSYSYFIQHNTNSKIKKERLNAINRFLKTTRN